MRAPIYFLAFLLFSAPVYSGQTVVPALAEESEVNDIPFNTALIFMNCLKHPALCLDDEAYVNDIPFNTKKIALEEQFDNMVSAMEEADVDDIPFSTEKIANQASLKEMVSSLDEANVNDIPFDTGQLASDYLAGQAFASWYDESNVDDEIYCNTAVLKNRSKKSCKNFLARELEGIHTISLTEMEVKNLMFKYPSYLQEVKPSLKEIDFFSIAD
jgi:hypothetical protein